MVVMRIQVDCEPIGIRVFVIAAREAPLDLLRIAVVQTGADIQRFVIVPEMNLALLGRRAAFIRVVLSESGGCRGLFPRRFLQSPIEHDRPRNALRAH